MIESRIGKWLRKDSDNSDKIIIYLKLKKKKRLEKLNACYFKEDLRSRSNECAHELHKIYSA